MEILVRFIIGGLVVSTFAVLGSVFKPTSFASVFGAAPSVALASLALAASKDGTAYAAVESRSMLLGAAALGVSAWAACQLMMRRRVGALFATGCSIAVGFVFAFSLWSLLLKA